METTYKKIVISLTALTFLVVSGCSSAAKHQDAQAVPGQETSADATPQIMGPPDPYGPTPAPPAPIYGPNPIRLRPAILVFGPGLARGFAYAGVLRAFEEAKIPIAGIVGVEMGALIGTLYSATNSINVFEWSLLEFKDEAFVVRKSLFSKILQKPNDGHILEETLKKTLAQKDLAHARIPTRVGIQVIGKNESEFLMQGGVALMLRAALAQPALMSPGLWEGVAAGSAGLDRAFPVSEARRIAAGPVILVDVLTGKQNFSQDKRERLVIQQMIQSKRKAQLEREGADLVITPNLDGLGYLDFQKRTEIAFRGKSAVIERLSEIRKLVGMPENKSINEMETTP